MVFESYESLPLQDRESAGHPDKVFLEAGTHNVKVLFRGSSASSSWQDAFKDSTGIYAPQKPNTVVMGTECSAFWLGPDETLVRFKPGSNPVSAERLVSDARSSFSGGRAAVVDVSDYYCLIHIGGLSAQQVLEKGTPLDIVWALPDEHSCAQTRFGTAAILLNRADDAQNLFHIQVRWSFADYVWQLLSRGMKEYL